MPEFKPIAHATPEGRVAVYIGAGYQKLTLAAAKSLHAQLATGIAEAEATDHAAPESFDVQIAQQRTRVRSAPPDPRVGEARHHELERRAMAELDGEDHG